MLVLAISADSVAAQDLPAPSPRLSGLLSEQMPKFPPGLVGNKAGDAEVVLAISIDDEGNVSDSVALEATNKQVADAATIAVMQWKFSATPRTSISENLPWPRREVVQFTFKRSGVITSMSHAESARDAFVSTPVPELRTVQVKDLTIAPQPIKTPMPVLPSVSANQSLLINFVIDQQGVVRVPVITGMRDPESARIILAAIKSWRYSPSLQKHQRVAVELNQQLVLPLAP